MIEKTISIKVSGKVQGVFYRQSTRELALKLGITGVVRNQPDGTVHILARGNSRQLDELVRWCHQGPPKAKVTRVETAEIELQFFTDFTISR